MNKLFENWNRFLSEDSELESVYQENPLDLNMPPRVAYLPKILKARMEHFKAFVNSCAEQKGEMAPFPGSLESVEQNRETHEQIEELEEQLKELSSQIKQLELEHQDAERAPPELVDLYRERLKIEKQIKKLEIEVSTAVRTGLESFKGYAMKCGGILSGSPEDKLSRLEKNWRSRHKAQWGHYRISDHL